ncbi:MAG: hypothetical protein ACKO34_07520 [Vampirovibrionales bacterium]
MSSRNRSSLNKPKKQKTTSPYAFVVEGDTEYDYIFYVLQFKNCKNLKNAQGHGNLQKAVDEMLTQARRYDKVFVVFDMDTLEDSKVRNKMETLFKNYTITVPIPTAPNFDWLVAWNANPSRKPSDDSNAIKKQICHFGNLPQQFSEGTNYKTAIEDHPPFQKLLQNNLEVFITKLQNYERYLTEKEEAMNPTCLQSRKSNTPNSAMGAVFEILQEETIC